MVKKQKEETPNVNSTANRDVVQRLNFLYQASVYLQSIAPAPVQTTKGEATEADRGEGSSKDQALIKDVKKERKRRRVSQKSTADLARSYVQCMHVVGQKTTVKIDPSIKRTLCNHCSTTLVPGSSASVRVKSSRAHGHIMVYTCLHCKVSKRVPAPEIAPAASSTVSTPSPPTLAGAANTGDDDVVMGSSDIASTTLSKTKMEKKLEKKARRARLPPLFARPDAGHTIFRGNAQLPVDPANNGFGTFLV